MHSATAPAGRRQTRSGPIFVNPSSGPDDDTADRLRGAFPSMEVVEVAPDRITEAVDEALARRSALVGVAGGDGTIRCAAGRMLDRSVPLLALPAGTKNHFARAVGLPTFDAAAQALAEGRVHTVDCGTLNGEVFLNTASLGVYPLIVRARRSIEDRLPKQLATFVAAWRQSRTLVRVPVAVDGGPSRPAWMVFVGNGRYGTTVFQAAERTRLDAGELDVRICYADGRFSRLRAIAALVAGRLDRSRMVTHLTTDAVDLGISDRDTVEVALDGEVLTFQPPLQLRSRRGALSVYAGSEAATAG